MNKDIVTTNKNSKLALSKAKNLIKITNQLLVKNEDVAWISILLKWFDTNIVQERTMHPKTDKELFECAQLSLRWNRLKTIPHELYNLEKLEVLELNNNAIENLPDDIEKLINLNHLNLNINILKTLPRGIVKLQKLKYLNIKNNKYLELTKEQISWLQELKKNGCEVIHDKYKFNLGE